MVVGVCIVLFCFALFTYLVGLTHSLDVSKIIISDASVQGHRNPIVRFFPVSQPGDLTSTVLQFLNLAKNVLDP